MTICETSEPGFKEKEIERNKICRTGWPMEYLKNTLSSDNRKEDIILFPHRIAPEKQLEIFKDLSRRMPDFEFIVCQEKNLSKAEYHTLLRKSKIVFSGNLQETLGISCYEAALSGALPMVPDRLSYSEMYTNTFKYPSNWTESYDDYLANADLVENFIREWIENFDLISKELPELVTKLDSFFSCDDLLKGIFNGK